MQIDQDKLQSFMGRMVGEFGAVASAPLILLGGAVLLLSILVGLRLAYVPLMGESGLDMTVIALGTCLIIMAAAQTQWKGPWLLAPLIRLGQRSYEVYLTHMLVVFAFFAIFMHYGNLIWSVPLLFVATVIVTAVAGGMVARYFSEPVNRTLRERWSEGPRQVGGFSDS